MRVVLETNGKLSQTSTSSIQSTNFNASKNKLTFETGIKSVKLAFKDLDATTDPQTPRELLATKVASFEVRL